MALLDKTKLSEDELKSVNGGYLYAGDGINGVEVIDDHDGSVITTCSTADEARAYCEEHGISPKYLYWYELVWLRENSRGSGSDYY